MVKNSELKELKEIVLLTTQAFRYYSLKRMDNVNNKEVYESCTFMLKQVLENLFESTKDVLSADEISRIQWLHYEENYSMQEMNHFASNFSNIVYHSEGFNNPAKMSNEVYQREEMLFGILNENNEFSLEDYNDTTKTILAAGSIISYKDKIENITGIKLSPFKEEYRMDLGRGELKTKEELEEEKKRAIGIIYHGTLPLEEKRNVLKAIGHIYDYYDLEVDRTKRIETGPKTEDIYDDEEREFEENERKVRL